MSLDSLKRDLPTAIVFVTGVAMILAYFIQAPEAYLGDIASNLLLISSVVAGYAVVLGILTLSMAHIGHVYKRTKGQWIYSLILLVLALVMIAVGLIGKVGTHPYFKWFYQFPMVALETTIYSVLAFYIVSAAFRAFRIRSLEALVLFLTGLFVMLMNAPVGAAMWEGFPIIGGWIMSVPNASGFRGFIIGSAIGAIAIGLRVLLGRERGALGRA